MTIADRLAPAAVTRCCDVIRDGRFHYADEDQLQQGLLGALVAAGLEVRREFRLGPGERIDFLVNGVGIEAKVAGRPDAVLRQLTRYAEHDAIEALVLVTSRVRHLAVPAQINGKPVEVVSLLEAGL